MAPTDIYILLDIDIEQTENNKDNYIKIQRNVDADADEMDFELTPETALNNFNIEL